MRDYLDRRIGGRPLMVYLVLFAGAATLLLLLIIVWISATGGGESEQPICLDIAKQDAISQVYSGSVKRVNVLIDEANPTLGPSALQLDMSDGSCRKLPQGADNQSGMLEVLGEPLLARSDLRLIGDHNVANALAASLAVVLASESHRTPQALGAVARGLRTFQGLEHRIETVAELNGVLWINDSKSTNVASTEVALRGMTRPTVLLLGGRHKGEPYTALIDQIRRTVKVVLAYGESAPIIEGDLGNIVPVERLGKSFPDLVAAARRVATTGDVVLLSPACSSYDMFENYEQRGREFKRLVNGASTKRSSSSRDTKK